MQLRDACVSAIEQMEVVVGQLSDDDFTRPSLALNNVSIGEHLRHTIEFFLCLESGYSTGLINYDKRAHNKLIETDRTLAMLALDRIKSFVTRCDKDKSLRLEVGYDRNSDQSVAVDTNYFRELIYNIEHAVHHMALMKIGVREVAPYVEVPTEFGVAVSTLRHADLTRASS